MPVETVLQRRNKALFAFTLLSGARVKALATLSLQHIDLDKRTVFQDARQVQTKNRKTSTINFFPVGDDVEVIVKDWIEELTNKHLFSPEDPLFPATKVGLGESGLFEAIGLERRHWKSGDAIRKIFKAAFESAGLPYFHPHSFRRTLAVLGERICRTPEEFKAWSQNLSHEHVLTTFTSYGKVASDRQAEILDELRGTGKPGASGYPDEETIQRVVEYLSNKAS